MALSIVSIGLIGTGFVDYISTRWVPESVLNWKAMLPMKILKQPGLHGKRQMPVDEKATATTIYTQTYCEDRWLTISYAASEFIQMDLFLMFIFLECLPLVFPCWKCLISIQINTNSLSKVHLFLLAIKFDIHKYIYTMKFVHQNSQIEYYMK